MSSEMKRSTFLLLLLPCASNSRRVCFPCLIEHGDDDSSMSVSVSVSSGAEPLVGDLLLRIIIIKVCTVFF